MKSSSTLNRGVWYSECFNDINEDYLQTTCGMDRVTLKNKQVLKIEVRWTLNKWTLNWVDLYLCIVVLKDNGSKCFR